MILLDNFYLKFVCFLDFFIIKTFNENTFYMAGFHSA